MSRLIVKSLPAYLDEARLKAHFAARFGDAAITDATIRRRPDGTSRRFGFVGFKSDAIAGEAKDYFDRTFVDTSRISVDVAKKIGDENLPQRGAKRAAPESASTAGPSGKRRALASGVDSTSKPKATDDKKPQPSTAEKKAKKSAEGVSFDEFMAVMQPKSKRKTWADGDAVREEVDFTEDVASAGAKKKDKKKAKSEAAAEATTSKAGQSEPKPAPVDNEREVTPDAAVNDEGLTDMDYLAKRMRRKVGADFETEEQENKEGGAPVKEFEQSEDEAEAEQASSESEDEDDEAAAAALEKERKTLEEKARKEQETADAIMETGRLFIRNLPFEAKEEELEAHFARWGAVKQAHIPVDKVKKTSKGMGFVTFQDPVHALAAYRATDGSDFQGRLLHILPAVDARPVPEGAAKATSLKQDRAKQRKEMAGREFNWSSLYMSQDAVASSVADRLGISKADILSSGDSTSDGLSPAVKLALAETRIVTETKEWLEKEGIDLDAFGGDADGDDAAPRKRVPRSDTTILVKNIPYGTSSEAVEEMFAAHGAVSRVLLPPAGTMAVVEMDVPNEARVAFRSLAYKRIGNSILYLEKAPVGLFKEKPSKGKDDGDDDENDKSNGAPSLPAKGGKEAPPSKTALVLGSGVGSEASVEPGATLFVKNLSFSTTDQGLADAFSAIDGFAFCRIQTRLGKATPNAPTPPRLSMGYGFVGFKSADKARAAKAAMDGRELDGHALSIDFAKRGHDSDDVASGSNVKSGSGSGKTTKVVVKNLPFEATKKDVRDLFSAHGQLKSVRVPRKPAASGARGASSGARGFAFVEFTSRKEAEVAMAALRHTHLLGRHLVLGWDEEDARGVDGLRAKTKAAFAGPSVDEDGQRIAGAGGPAKKAKLRLGAEDIQEAVRREKKRRSNRGEDAADDDDDDDE